MCEIEFNDPLTLLLMAEAEEAEASEADEAEIEAMHAQWLASLYLTKPEKE